MALHVSKSYPTTLIIDGERVAFRVRRLTIDEFTPFAYEFNRQGLIHEADELAHTRRAGEESLSERQIRAQRWRELSPEARHEQEQTVKAETERGNTFATESITAYITAEPNAVWDDDDNCWVTAGADLVRVFGARPDVLRDLVVEIFLQNRLSEEEKKKLRLLRASATGSGDPDSGAGAKPASTAASVEPGASASPAGASALPDENPSGSMAP
jgi:hypothetical protein